MIKYPKDPASRAARRNDLRRDIFARANAEANHAGKSLKCAGYRLLSTDAPRHACDPDGCRNDGSTCLCDCHDHGATSG